MPYFKPVGATPLTRERLKELLHYDEETGVFTWKESRGRRKAGSVAGCSLGRHWGIGIEGTTYLAHRLAWFYVHGSWPYGEVGHWKRPGSSDAIGNLQTITRSESLQNRTEAIEGTKSGLLGVHWDAKRNRWVAFITVDKRRKFLGRYVDKNKAHAAYLRAKVRLHTFYRNSP